MNDTAAREMELTLPLMPDFEISAAQAAMDLARDLGMADEPVDELAHAIIEACINVAEHSGCADERIYLKFAGSTLNDRPRLEIWIMDHGHGFDPIEVKNRRKKRPNHPQKRGWGLKIIEAHMDEVEIDSSEGGTTVRMVKVGRRKNDD
jgi:serine/threonine-protein kinase RsbW